MLRDIVALFAHGVSNSFEDTGSHVEAITLFGVTNSERRWRDAVRALNPNRPTSTTTDTSQNQQKASSQRTQVIELG
jgi:hypothetical protein